VHPTTQGAPKGCLHGLNVDHAVPGVASARGHGTVMCRCAGTVTFLVR
jgi:hypothetical protein